MPAVHDTLPLKSAKAHTLTTPSLLGFLLGDFGGSCRVALLPQLFFEARQNRDFCGLLQIQPAEIRVDFLEESSFLGALPGFCGCLQQSLKGSS